LVAAALIRINTAGRGISGKILENLSEITHIR
jgi:hypothetical protein